MRSFTAIVRKSTVNALRNYLNQMNELTDNLPHHEEGDQENTKERQHTGAYDLGESR